MNLTDLQILLCMVCLLTAPLACAGLALINTGLGRSRNAAHSTMAALCAVAAACCAYFVVGRCWDGSMGEAARILTVRGQSWNFIGVAKPFLMGLGTNPSPVVLKALLSLTAVSIAAMIPLGSGAERWRLRAVCASTALLAGVTYPLFAHGVWSGGWLAQLGLVDAGGSGAIHAVGGFTALAITWILGARRGKFGHDGMPVAVPGHNIVLVLFGCLLASQGWVALNTAGAILFYGVEPLRMAPIAVATILGAASGGLVAAAITAIRYGRPDASLTANGWVGGLVATAAGCAFMPAAAAVMTGLIAGAIVTASIELLELRLDVDDPGGSISVHAMAGIWGLLAAGIFGRFPDGGHMTGQIVGIATLIGLVFPLTWGLNWLLDRALPMRVPRDGERQGLDLFELGAGAYPDFVTHSDEFMQR